MDKTKMIKYMRVAIVFAMAVFTQSAMAGWPLSCSPFCR